MPVSNLNIEKVVNSLSSSNSSISPPETPKKLTPPPVPKKPSQLKLFNSTTLNSKVKFLR